jgi:hypothetical protein
MAKSSFPHDKLNHACSTNFVGGVTCLPNSMFCLRDTALVSSSVFEFIPRSWRRRRGTKTEPHDSFVIAEAYVDMKTNSMEGIKAC